MAESFLPGIRVCDVARKHGLTPQHLTSWRRLAREGRLVLPADEEAMTFAPVLVDEDAPGADGPAARDHGPGVIEIETCGIVLRVPLETSPQRLAGLVSALRKTP